MKLSEREMRFAGILYYIDKHKDENFTENAQDLNKYIETCLNTYGGTKLQALFERAVNLLLKDN